MYAVVRLRGQVNISPDVRTTLKNLRLNKVNHMIVIPQDQHNKGMIQRVKDYVAWGEIDAETLALLLENRGRLTGGKRLTEDYIKEHTTYKGFQSLAEAVVKGEYSLKDVPDMKPVFRLHPPRKGHRGIKHAYQVGGELGYHGKEITQLLKKMR